MLVKLLYKHILMRDEIKRLREINRKQTRKRQKSTKQISYKGSLRGIPDPAPDVGGEEGATVRYISNPTPAPEPDLEPTLPVLPPMRRQITCSVCGQKGHSMRKCSQT
jgi:hypothetical protein